MSALVENIAAGVVVQGATGRVARRHLAAMLEYGTPVLAGVSPGHGGETVRGVPVFDTVADAVTGTQAQASVAFLPPEAVGDGITEAAHAGIRLTVSVTEGADLHDMLPALQYARYLGMTVIGPNSAGLLLPGRFLLGFLPARFARPGRVAVLARSGTLSYEVVLSLSQAGIGVSVWVGVGGDQVKGATFADLLPRAAAVPGTEAIVLVGEIGGSDEQDAAPVVASLGLPAVALLAGRTAPAGVLMGHAGALIDGPVGAYEAKAHALSEAGVLVCRSPTEVATALSDLGMTGAPRGMPAIGAP
jgi:succinyl-CoA synthetase alpha subunit